ncbi:hypothetical protein CPLU01_13752 [Colletotrichum plurivorum]|uniref:Uncharacterized protein n=1 Tax=Colletotrichum plurivorum TaxID=2175906 RepID=A0A8H6N288_9PEZI|nr:hypothetical protein CPLU01_13752 [Colletotrichum plurivorum]
MHAKSVLLLALGALASAQSFVGFPKTLICELRSGEGIITTDDMRAAVASARRTLSTPNAADENTRYCHTLQGIPLYAVSLSPITLAGKGTFRFAEDTKTNTVTFCDSTGDITDFSIGYPARCQEAY